MNISQGSIHLYFCFEVANEILLEKIEKNEKVLGKSFVFSPLEYRRLTPKYIQYKAPPLMVNLGLLKIGEYEFEIIAKIYNFGVITIKMLTPVTDNFEQLAKRSQELVENQDLRKTAEAIVRKITRAIHYALKRAYQELEWEDYTIFVVNRLKRPLTASDLTKRYSRQIASILRSELQLSEQEVADALKNPLSYTPRDLVLIDWNAAFVYDQQLSYDVLDVLEYAVIELLELRTYDDMLDESLDRSYDDISQRKRHSLLGLTTFRPTLDKLYQIKVDISSFIDKVENALKLVGDLYLAKVYNAAASRFYLGNWKNSVKEKLNTIQNIYTMLQEQASNQQMLILEIIIVFLFILDILMYFR